MHWPCLKTNSQKVRLPAGVEIPDAGRQIDCSFKTITKQHSMKGPFCHVGSLINKDDVPDDMVARWRKMFQKTDPKEFMGIDLFDRLNDRTRRITL